MKIEINQPFGGPLSRASDLTEHVTALQHKTVFH